MKQLTEDGAFNRRSWIDPSLRAIRFAPSSKPTATRCRLSCFRADLRCQRLLIFANSNHAEEIVNIVREVFGQGNDFAKNHACTTGDPEELIKAFRKDFNPRIAVTVDMIATGTDVKAIEVVMFLRDVPVRLYYEQMKGRGGIDPNELREATDAPVKDKFILIDAVGVTETAKTASQPLERKRTVSFERLLEQVASGARDDDTLSSLAGRHALSGRLPSVDRARIRERSGSRDLEDIARSLLDAISRCD